MNMVSAAPSARWTSDRVYGLLSQTVGDQKAKDVVDAAARGLALDLRAGLTVDQVLDVLDRIAESPGIVGITARFAKSRVHLSG